MMENTFIKACQNNDKTITGLLIDKGGLDLNHQDDLGNTGLHYLCTNDNFNLAEKLIIAGAKVGIENFHLKTPLHLAASSGSTLLIKLLLSNGADINAQDRLGVTPLIEAIRSKQAPAAEFLIMLEANKYARTKNNLSAIDYIRAEGLDELLEHFENDPAQTDVNGDTPLHHAVFRNEPVAIKNILKNDKSFINTRNTEGSTPLLIAISKLNFAISDILLQYGADPNLVNAKDENSPLHIAAMNGITWLGEILLGHGAYLNAVNLEGETPLMLAVQGQHKEFIILLLHNNAITDIADNNKKTALDYARNLESSEFAELLETGKPRPAKKGH